MEHVDDRLNFEKWGLPPRTRYELNLRNTSGDDDDGIVIKTVLLNACARVEAASSTGGEDVRPKKESVGEDNRPTAIFRAPPRPQRGTDVRRGHGPRNRTLYWYRPLHVHALMARSHARDTTRRSRDAGAGGTRVSSRRFVVNLIPRTIFRARHAERTP